jgi:hypothetical protein
MIEFVVVDCHCCYRDDFLFGTGCNARPRAEASLSAAGIVIVLFPETNRWIWE